jgi:hypothetical protein
MLCLLEHKGSKYQITKIAFLSDLRSQVQLRRGVGMFRKLRIGGRSRSLYSTGAFTRYIPLSRFWTDFSARTAALYLFFRSFEQLATFPLGCTPSRRVLEHFCPTSTTNYVEFVYARFLINETARSRRNT